MCMCVCVCMLYNGQFKRPNWSKGKTYLFLSLGQVLSQSLLNKKIVAYFESELFKIGHWSVFFTLTDYLSTFL